MSGIINKSTTLILITFLAGCAASQAPQSTPVETTQSQQKQLQEELSRVETPAELILKRKIAVGRLTNETNYGRSLLRESVTGQHDQKISDMFMQAIVNTNRFLIFERTDLNVLRDEMALNPELTENLIGVDTLVIGSLTEFGRNTTGERGFFSTSQRQAATATVDLRLVDVTTGRVIASFTGTGDSSVEQSRVMGFGSVAGYDGSVNDMAIGAAVTSAVEKMTEWMLENPWTADILAIEDSLIYISGGQSQGVDIEMEFDIYEKGRQVRSATRGANITLPGRKIARLKVDGLFGDDLLDQGAFGRLIEGNLDNLDITNLEVRPGE